MLVKDGICHASSGATPLHVIDCVALGGHSLRFEFNEGTVLNVDLEPLLSYPIFKRLADETVFSRFSIDHEVVTWCDGEINIAPEWLFEHGAPQAYPSTPAEDLFVAEGNAAPYGHP